MRPLELARIAIDAETIRLRYVIGRAISSILLGLVAIVLGLWALLYGHVAGWYLLREHLSAMQTALVLGGINLMLMVILGSIALRSSPGRVERESRAVRRQALEHLESSLEPHPLVVSLLVLFRGLLKAKKTS